MKCAQSVVCSSLLILLISHFSLYSAEAPTSPTIRSPHARVFPPRHPGEPVAARYLLANAAGQAAKAEAAGELKDKNAAELVLRDKNAMPTIPAKAAPAKRS